MKQLTALAAVLALILLGCSSDNSGDKPAASLTSEELADLIDDANQTIDEQRTNAEHHPDGTTITTDGATLTVSNIDTPTQNPVTADIEIVNNTGQELWMDGSLLCSNSQEWWAGTDPNTSTFDLTQPIAPNKTITGTLAFNHPSDVTNCEQPAAIELVVNGADKGTLWATP